MRIGGNCSESRKLVPAARRWRVEQSGALDTPREDARRPAQPLANFRNAKELRTSRCGTRVIDAEQQLFKPGFVAQVLGQMLGTTSVNRIAAARAYTRNNLKNLNPQFAEIA